jgi:hypothetical protein
VDDGHQLAQNYWVFGLSPSPGIIANRKHNVSETGSISILRCGGGGSGHGGHAVA